MRIDKNKKNRDKWLCLIKGGYLDANSILSTPEYKNVHVWLDGVSFYNILVVAVLVELKVMMVRIVGKSIGQFEKHKDNLLYHTS